MMIWTQEHYDLMSAFERDHRGYRVDREAKDLWPKGNVYQSGETNALFLAYRNGAAFAKSYYRDGSVPGKGDGE